MDNETFEDSDPLLDTDFVAHQILKCTANWLERLRCEGRGPAYVKIGRLIRYRRSAIDQWLAENTVAPTEKFGRRRMRKHEMAGAR